MKKSSVLPFILALSVVGAGLWIADYSMSQKEELNRHAIDTQENLKNVPRNIAAPQQLLKHPIPTETDVTSVASGISKCFINGKVIYSNDGCPQGAKPIEVRLHDSAGFVSPPKESLDDLIEKRVTREKAFENAARQIQRANQSKPSKAGQCELLSEEITSLDAMAKQPQSGQMQDWIRGKRQSARDRQFSLGC